MKTNRSTQKHEFALYIPDLSQLVSGKMAGHPIIVDDKDLMHRITIVLRLGIGQLLILFDQKIQVHVTIHDVIKKKAIHVLIDQINKNSVYKPYISFWLPVLKRDALEAALYSLCEVGVSQIQLIAAQKGQTITAKEYERAHKIIIAAAEQSKNFAFPDLFPPVDIPTAIKHLKKESTRLFFDPTGIPFFEFLKSPARPSDTIILAIGPEGDLSQSEKEHLKDSAFDFYALTPTILRASSAAALSAGMIRSLFR